MISADKFKEIQEKHRNLIIAIILLLVFLLDFVFLLRPQLRILGRISQNASVLARNIKNTRSDIASQKEFENKLTTLRSRVSNLGMSVTPEEELPSVVEKISHIAKQTYVKITHIKPIKEEKAAVLKVEGGVYYRIPIQIDAQCGYHQLGEFLNKLENAAIFVKIIGLEIASNAKDMAHHLVRLTLQTFVSGK